MFSFVRKVLGPPALEPLRSWRFISISEGRELVVNRQKLTNTSRALSTVQNRSHIEDEAQDFMAVFPELVRDLSEVTKQYKCNEAAAWFAKALQYNMPLGKKQRGITAVTTYKNLVKPETLTPENIKLAQYLGWCIEMVQCFFLIYDDIMDNSATRRGQLCWHQVEDVGMIAINDTLMIENSIYIVLKKHFRHLDCYIDLLELFQEVNFLTTWGQLLDMLNSSKSVTAFNMDIYKSIVAYKTSYYTFYLPFAVALHLAGFKDPEAFRQSKTILLEMGHLFQVQDDFLDCFGNPEITGKVGTDIQDNKCSWLAVVCMQRANNAQKATMIECYGKSDPDKVERVKLLYNEMGLPKTYATFEEESYNLIKTQIQQSSRGIPHAIFLQLLERSKQRKS